MRTSKGRIRPLDKGGTGDLRFEASCGKSPTRYARRPLYQGGCREASIHALFGRVCINEPFRKEGGKGESTVLHGIKR